MSVDDAIARALAADSPPARDPAFTLALLRRLARAERRRVLAARGITAAALGVSALALWPILPAWLADPGPVFQAMILGLGAATAALAFLRAGRPSLSFL